MQTSSLASAPAFLIAKGGGASGVGLAPHDTFTFVLGGIAVFLAVAAFLIKRFKGKGE